MTSATYSITIQHPNWGHHVISKSSRRDAIKVASDLRRLGNSWTDTELPDTLKHCSVVVSHSEEGEIYNKPFTKTYIAGIRRPQQ